MSDAAADDPVGRAEERRRGRSTPALVTIAILGVLALLYVAEAVFLPAVLALLLSLLLRPPVRWLAKLGIPTALASMLVLGAIGAGVAGVAAYLAQPTAEWMQRLPNSLPEIQRKLESLRRPVEQVNAAAKRVEAAASAAAADARRPVPVEVATPSLSHALVTTTQRFFAGASITLILLFFLLASGDGFMVRVARLFPSSDAPSGNEVVLGANGADRAHELLLETEHQMTRYLVMFTLLNLGFGALTWLAMTALGLPNALLWALVGCVFNYIPYLGNLITVSLIGAVSLLSFDRAVDALWPPLAFIVIRSIEGNFVMPWLVSRRFAMNTVAVFVWTVFWTWMWGVLGGFVAVPILALIKLVSERVDRLRPIAAFLEP